MIDRRGLTLEEFWPKLGISRATLFNWLRRDKPPPSKEHQDKLVEFFAMDRDYILFGRPSGLDPSKTKASGVKGGGVVMELVRRVPLVSWTHAGAAANYEELPLDWQEQVATTSTDPHAIALTIEGDSMLPDFKQGDRVILAPSREPRNGRAVVAKLNDDGVVLRIFHRLPDGRIRLTSLRPEIYPTYDYDAVQFQWIWPVEELNRKI